MISTSEVLAWISWISYPEDKTLIFRWTSPLGEIFESKDVVHPGWMDTTRRIPVLDGLELGRWKFDILDNQRKLISVDFDIRTAVK